VTLHVETHQASALLHKVGHGALALGQQLIDGDGLHAEGLGCLTAGGVQPSWVPFFDTKAAALGSFKDP